jgi:hypothetical protein
MFSLGDSIGGEDVDQAAAFSNEVGPEGCRAAEVPIGRGNSPFCMVNDGGPG